MVNKDGYTLMEAVRITQKRFKCSEAEAKEHLLKAMRSGEVQVTGVVYCQDENAPCSTPKVCLEHRGCIRRHPLQ